MAIAFDAVNSASHGSSVSSLTSGAYTLAGSNRVLFGFSGTTSGPTRDPTGMKWGGSSGTALTQIGSILTIGSFGKLAAFFLIAPSTASSTLFSSYSGSADEAVQSGIDYTGVDQTTPNGTAVTNTGTIATTSGTASATVTTAVGDVVLACCMAYDGNFQGPQSAPAGSPLPTERLEDRASADFIMAVEEVVATGTSTTVSFAITSGASNMNMNWGVIAFVIKAAGGGGDVSVNLTGQSLTSASGTLGAATAKALTGSSLTSASGTLTPALARTLTGSAITFGQGSVSASGDVTLTLTGQALAASAGTLIPAFTMGLTGQAILGTAGSLTPVTAKPITGSALAIASGSVSPSVALALSGSLLTIGQGAVSAPGNVTLTLTGQTLTSAQGAFTPATSKALTGSSATASAGTVSPATAKTLTGQSLTAAQGAFDISFSVSITGTLMSLSPGTIAVAGAGEVSEVRLSYSASFDPSTFRVRPDPTRFRAKKLQ